MTAIGLPDAEAQSTVNNIEVVDNEIHIDDSSISEFSNVAELMDIIEKYPIEFSSLIYTNGDIKEKFQDVVANDFDEFNRLIREIFIENDASYLTVINNETREKVIDGKKIESIEEYDELKETYEDNDNFTAMILNDRSIINQSEELKAYHLIYKSRF